MDGGAIGEETGRGMIGWQVVVLLVREGFEVVGARLDRRRLEIGGAVGVVSLDDAHVVKEELVAAGAAEVALLEKHPDLAGTPVVIVGHHLDDHRHLVRGVAFVHDMLEHHLVVADPGAFVDGALDHIAGDTGLLGLLHRGEQPGVGLEIGAAEFGGDGHFLHKFADRLTFFKVNDRAFCVEPLTSHGAESGNGARVGNAEVAVRWG